MDSAVRLLSTPENIRGVWGYSPIRAATMDIPSPADKGMPVVYTYRPYHDNGDNTADRVPSKHILDKPDLPERRFWSIERGQGNIVNIL